MNSVIKILLSLLVVLAFTGCSSFYKYQVEPTPIKSGESQYILNNLNLKFENGHGHNPENKTFTTPDELKKNFEKSITKHLKEKNIFSNDGYLVDVNLYFARIFNYGGNALNKPEFYYSVTIKNKDNKSLAYFAIPRSTTKYSYFKELAVAAEIIAFQRHAEDELEDIDLISKTLVNELFEAGD